MAMVANSSGLISLKTSSEFVRTEMPCLRAKCQRHFRGKGMHVTNSISSSNSPVAPLEPESPTGKFLVSILSSHPHLFPAAAERQLELLNADKETSAAAHDVHSSGSELVLYKRIGEVKEQERRKAVVELMYTLVVQKFLAMGISMTPKLPKDSNNRERIDKWPSQEKELVSIHSSEVGEIVRAHLEMIIGEDDRMLVQTSKVMVGYLYAASIGYGYLLRRIDQRYQLDQQMKKALGALKNADVDVEGEGEGDGKGEGEGEGEGENVGDSLAAEAAEAVLARRRAEIGKGGGGLGQLGTPFGKKESKLRKYVGGFNEDTLNKCMMLRSDECVNVIDKQTQALFGRPNIEIGEDGKVVLSKQDSIVMSVSGLRRLMLEAIGFGSFLWDVESYVDSNYALVHHRD